jgi:hypothetical protein
MNKHFKQIKAGADIHAGDGGYKLGTQEEYEAFVKGRNRSLAKSKIHELMLEAGYAAPEIAGRANKLAELIVAEACQVLSNWKGEPFPFDEDLAVSLIKEHFGVK